jgi:hypothetical protein
MGLRVLLLDIETAPNTAFVWGLYDQDVGLSQIIDTSYILCWAAKWLGEPYIHFERTLHQKRSSKGMLRHIHGLMECADMIVTYNGNKFDIPTLNREFLIHGIPPPAPTKLMDLYQHVKRRFRFSSNKMDHVGIYDRILPWLPNQGHAVRNDGQLVCPNCGAAKYQQRGFQYSQVAKYVRFQCLECFHWFRTTSNELPKQPVKFVSL